MPITLDRPRCLLPLVNVPVIEYTFEFLAISGVQEVILFCRSHADQIKQYISKSRWSKPTSTMHIQVVVNSECMSMGDAMRDIDSRSIIHGDFILVCGDVVSNMSLVPVLEAHKRRRQTDKNYILTMVLKESSPYHRTRERCENGIFAIDTATRECLSYEPIETETLKEVTLPLAKLAAVKELSVRYDLMDCNIDVCSVNVLALYTENFDYQEMRKDFLRGVLTSDILGVRVSTHILTNEYASRVRSPHLYDSISKDLIERWVFPVVPDADILEEQPYKYRRGNAYFGPDVILSRTAQVGNGTVLGRGVSIGDNSVVRNSVIGAHCQIGNDVIIENAYIWDHTNVEHGSRVMYSILADNVRVRSNTVINRGCLVTSNIALGPGAEILPRTRIAKLGEHIDFGMRQLSIGEGLDCLKQQTVYLGEGTDAVVWEGQVDEFEGVEEDADPAIQAERHEAFDIGTDFHTSRPQFDDAVSEDDMEEDEAAFGTDDEASNAFGRNSVKFFADAFDLMKHAIETDYLVDNALLEINGLKFSCNATFGECRQVILKALFAHINPDALPKSVDQLFLKWSPLLVRFTQGVEEQVDLIRTVKDTCADHSALERAFQFVIPVLYKADVLDEEAVLAWFRQEQEPNDLYVRQIRSFVQWLQQDEGSETGSDSD